MFCRIVTCAFCVQSWLTAKSVFAIFRLLLIFNIGAIFPVLCIGKCPSTSKLQEVSFACFTSYSTHRANLEKSGRRLFSGIDIEILRAYCSSYIGGMTCIKQLMDICPDKYYSDIKIGITHLKGTEKELADLCRTQNLYEIYAQYMTCFSKSGNKSEGCLDSKLSKTVHRLPHEEFCSHVREATECVENVIRQGCNEQAAELVHLLVKPTIRDSGTCNYNVYNPDTSDQPTVVKDGTGNSGTHNGGANGKPTEQGKRDATHSSNRNNSSKTVSCNVSLMLLTTVLVFVSNTLRSIGIS